jgi:hypothetical protein
MKIKQFKVTLLEDVVMTERAASEGGHNSLDYLPGATLLGAVAAHWYKNLLKENPEDVYTVFHSGKVRFGNGLPLSKDEQLSYPMPLCWYQDKRQPKSGTMALRNYQFSEYPKNIRAKQIQADYISLAAIEPENRLTIVKPNFRMKTGIDADVGTARDSQLFGYSSLPADNSFIFSLEADDDVKPSLFEEIVERLLGTLKLGRSRSAEYGAVSIEEYETKDERQAAETSSSVTFWLLADMALQDEFGQPVLQPTAKNVGLPADFKLDLAKTFVRSRRYAPFNAHRCRREIERVVLSMGSVLHFKSQNNQSVDAETLQIIQSQGIGLYRQNGLGRIWINPKLLAEKTPKFNSVKREKKTSFRLKEPNHLILRYLNKRKGQSSEISTIEKQAKEWLDELARLYRSAVGLSYTPVGTCPGPTATQWGQVMEKAKQASSVQELSEILFVGEHAVCKENDALWGKRIFIKDKPKFDNFRLWLKQKIKTEKQQKILLQIVARFARLARDVAANAVVQTTKES